MDVETSRPARPIVAVGASAGGLEALEKFFRHMRADTGGAFVEVQHLDPQHPSILPELLARYTAMTVTAIQSGTSASPNHVHVIPPNTELFVEKGILRLAKPSKPRGQRYPIDALFASLEQDLGPRSAGIVLSGTGTDGTHGLRAIKLHGGVAIAQDPRDAAYPGMPSSARGEHRRFGLAGVRNGRGGGDFHRELSRHERGAGVRSRGRRPCAPRRTTLARERRTDSAGGGRTCGTCRIRTGLRGGRWPRGGALLLGQHRSHVRTSSRGADQQRLHHRAACLAGRDHRRAQSLRECARSHRSS